MTSCANCGRLGAETTSPCGRCGWSIGQRSAQRSTKGPVAGAFAIALTTANAAGALSYLIGAITGVIALLIGPYKKDPWVRFHAFQSIFLTLIWLALMTVGETVLSVFEAMTGGFLIWLVIPICSLFTLASMGYWIFLMRQAFAGQRYEIPLVCDLAKWHAKR